MTKNCCYHCPNRHVGCHSQCAAYQKYRKELDEMNIKKHKAKKEREDYYAMTSAYRRRYC